MVQVNLDKGDLVFSENLPPLPEKSHKQLKSR